ncbi:NAD(P)-binding protein [Aspergillus sclerotiicarbonarius CBS 121057]|uniref:NAD(P)-binding protein n=1 Tax=Aspergillus sclerotiicarbonarius (strain CBS 121057 / IBT 28362) TaxID=1448318 RepID=A0A319EUC4_ASPSB|nr:NAD(P)-binding protein [Aspergillus sclerotiicarbonarius CBS 121057]
MAPQTIILISGANRGLGFLAAKSLLLSETNLHIIIGSRNLSDGNAAAASLLAIPNIHGTVSAIQLNVTDDKSVDAAKATIESTYGRLDILVNNAAIYLLNREPAREALRDSLETNVTGVVSLTEALLPLLKKSQNPRIVFVSSSMGSLLHNLNPDSPHAGTHATEYRVTKVAVNMLLVQYHMKLEGFKVLGADPGFCATSLPGDFDMDELRKMGAAEPETGAEIIASVVRGGKDDQPGRVHGPQGVVPW